MSLVSSVFRQGDVLLVRMGALPEGLSAAACDAKGRMVLAYGEVSGHAHVFDGALVKGFRHASSRPDEPDFIRVLGAGASLRHETDTGGPADHAAIDLPPGDYQVRRQREYSEARERRVID